MPGGLIGQARYVVGDTGNSEKNGRLRLYDLECNLVSQWEAKARLIAGDTAPTASLFAIGDERYGISVIREPEGRPMYSIADGRVNLAQLRLAFLESGRVLCGGTQPGPDDGSLRCWKLDTPRPEVFSEYAVTKGGTAPLATSSGGSVVMF